MQKSSGVAMVSFSLFSRKRKSWKIGRKVTWYGDSGWIDNRQWKLQPSMLQFAFSIILSRSCMGKENRYTDVIPSSILLDMMSNSLCYHLNYGTSCMKDATEKHSKTKTYRTEQVQGLAAWSVTTWPLERVSPYMSNTTNRTVTIST